jgi:peptidyl-prolyl cis-trans isomerase C
MQQVPASSSKPRVMAAISFVSVIALVTGILTACGNSTSGGDTVVATAGSHNITAGLFSAYTQQVAHGAPETLDPAYRDHLLKQLVQTTFAAEAEAKLGDQATAYQVELQRLDMLAKSGAKRAGVFDQPDEADVQKAYSAFVASLSASEFRVAQILVPTEAAALGVVRKLAAGADFATVAKTESADESRTRGGEIGWVHLGPLPKTFTDAVAALAPGQYTTQPVKSPYGWHVIRLLERRAIAAPPLAEVRAQLIANLQQEKYQDYLAKTK